MPQILVPSMLRQYSDGQSELTVQAETLGEVLQELEASRGELYRCVCDETGAVRVHVHLFVNDLLVARGDSLDVRLRATDVVSIMPAVSGG